MTTIRQQFDRSTQGQSEVLMKALNKLVEENAELDDLSVRQLSAVGVALCHIGHDLKERVLFRCRHEKLEPELYAGQHGKHQECSVCGASRVNYETGEIGFALSKVTKWSEWSLV